MKRVMSVMVKIELSADTLDGIAAAAMEAQSELKCDIAFYDKELGAYGAKMVEKGADQPDELTLFDIVLETTGLSEKQFVKDRGWPAAQARYMFAFYARRYLEWGWNRVANAIERDRTTAIQGVKGLVYLISGQPADEKNKNAKMTNAKSRLDRAIKARQDMERVQRKWAEAKK